MLQFLKLLKEYLAIKLKKYDSKIPYAIIITIALVIVILGIQFFVELTENLQTAILTDFDTQISEYVASFRTPTLTSYFTFITDVGDVWGYLISFTLCAILFYFFLKRWKYTIQLSLILILALSSNLLLKQLINRARPTLEHLVTVKTLSYPSGHAMTAMAFYGFLIYLIVTFKFNKPLKITIITLLSFLILSIGISRIYLGVHFPSDIVGGFAAGFIWVVFCILILNIIKIFKEDPAT
ncbi:phosphatase PAP2 family protein [Polaribacter sp. Hel_I_88]|uniref:phosphatase PAP2 family protein n=1 Tax=Polaribacter sp. Hel_I_88 TaxID=1250006 RepID=UPI00047998CB|nr:phosphatase PAP2 family protein [Polaribacter sp. Hel_I_88]